MSASELLLTAADMEEEETRRILCPFCKGGRSGEESMNVTLLEGTVLYNCHRATCLEKGAIGGRLVRTRRVQETPRPLVTPYTGELEELDDEWLNYLRMKIGWQAEHVALGRPRYAPDENRVAYPIFSPTGLRRGWVLRSYDRFARRKVLTRMDVIEPHLSWYRPHMGDQVLVVEDIPSAVRAAWYVDTVALCGGTCGPEYALEIQRYYPNVTWALDADATTQAINLHRKYGTLFESSTVLVLEKDIKDMTEEELCTIMEEDDVGT